MGRLSLCMLSVLGVLLSAANCGSFPYRWYVPDTTINFDQGKIKGPKEADDLPFLVCKPNDDNQAPCIVMLIDEFEKLKAERDALLEQLKDCQK